MEVSGKEQDTSQEIKHDYNLQMYEDDIYIFLNKAKDLPFSLNKEKFRIIQSTAKTKTKQNDHSRGIKLHRAFAPARHHNLSSAFILEVNMATVVELLRKTVAFLSFQIFHATKIASVAIAFLDCLLL
jgi:hypothetical protein